MVSNAVDASQKLITLSAAGEVQQEVGKLKVEVILDAKRKTLTIRDHGIGMTQDEVNKYINEVAFSGAEEFLEQYKDKDPKSIIGHFGLGFYSSFMVSSKVQIQTLSFKEGSKAVQWESNGDPTYELKEIKKATRGTDIILHIDKESKEFLEENRISGILNKYCKFLPVDIEFGTKQELVARELGYLERDFYKWKDSFEGMVEGDEEVIVTCGERDAKVEVPTIQKASDAYSAGKAKGNTKDVYETSIIKMLSK